MIRTTEKRRRRAGALLGAFLVSCLVAGCMYNSALPDYSKKNDEEPLPEVVPERLTRTTRWADGSPRARYDILLWPDGHEEREGSYVESWPDGSRRAERAYVRNVPTGTWRSWYENGQLRSEESFPGAGLEGHVRWWHANGQLSAEGATLEGVRQGPWIFWDVAGVETERVEYLDGMPVAPPPPFEPPFDWGERALGASDSQ